MIYVIIFPIIVGVLVFIPMSAGIKYGKAKDQASYMAMKFEKLPKAE